MQRVHPLVLQELLEELNEAEVPQVRAALAGGSDHQPPGDGPSEAQVIRFPIERVRRDSPKDTAGTREDQSKPPVERQSGQDVAPAENLWPAWMAKVLSGCYHAPAASPASQTGLTI